MEIKDAVQSAIAFATELLGVERTAGIRLEEVESSHASGKAIWLITLSISSNNTGQFAALQKALGSDGSRDYKSFAVTKDTGEVLAMKIRLLATA
jgi:hypothetical protein